MTILHVTKDDLKKANHGGFCPIEQAAIRTFGGRGAVVGRHTVNVEGHVLGPDGGFDYTRFEMTDPLEDMAWELMDLWDDDRDSEVQGMLPLSIRVERIA